MNTFKKLSTNIKKKFSQFRENLIVKLKKDMKN